uniref:Sulfotransfer_1 domain-containing protein n=1 Tax=Parastrongyloides trichosuri TaxID=131310 RepID=A0A0N4Z0V6_PARTI
MNQSRLVYFKGNKRFSLDIIEGFFNGFNEYRFSRKYKILTCFVHKNMCTVLSEILCLLDYPKLFKDGKKITDEGYQNRSCKKINEANTLSFINLPNNYESKTKNNWIYLMVIRNPIERFISGFIDRCDNNRINFFSPYKCFGCNRNLSCVLNNIYKRTINLTYNKNVFHRNADDYHFAPQTWRCNLKKNFDKFIFLNYSDIETFYVNLISQLRRNDVEEKFLKKIENELHSSRTYHSTIFSEKRLKLQRILEENVDMMALLVSIYYHDFVTFNFPIPNINLTITENLNFIRLYI